MIYNVAQLLKEGVGASRRRTASGDLRDIDELNPGDTHLEGELLFVRTPRGILVTGKAHVSVNQMCRRCLELTRVEIEFEIEEEFIPSIDIETGASLPITDEDEPELIIDEHHMLDMTEVLRQYVIVASMSPSLCRPDCKGLCPICGQNLNLASCQCRRDEIDPRLSILAQLLSSPEDE
ncbi:MAG: DUF177 domain-containing protein [Chloroflexi bacterium]|nr:DUF177 domain-containing protein [Chloroflexota bacterium]